MSRWDEERGGEEEEKYRYFVPVHWRIFILPVNKLRNEPYIRPDIRYPAFGPAGYPAKSVSGASLVVKNPDDLEKKNTVYFIKWLNQGWVYCSTISNFFTD